jgi:hypothetical protein
VEEFLFPGYGFYEHIISQTDGVWYREFGAVKGRMGREFDFFVAIRLIEYFEG